MVEIRIPDSIARRFERRIDFESWWKREVAKGIAQADTGKLVRAEIVMKRARRILRGR